MEKVDIRTIHGHLFTCDKCNKFHFEFNQIAIDFSTIQILDNFHDYLSKLQGDKFERLNRKTKYIRKIHIPFPNTAIKLVLSPTDLQELKTLIYRFIKEYKMIEEESIMIKKLTYISERQWN
ncbi:DUF6686 family protein [Saccharicrinis fermentans]|uniref:Uncharacterized protein n=1 Tax=Saccharicrinis fermentans DSM 9555 = JCM 21142 TaxID=869213 RepID=W7YJY0_9BACT|nr:DUF6686 family protein [Saccharicrinis fermentans]GAF02644.1 hypothetical protein JCM21142_31283 [Saccharicrinis fermentans DSM 9555 = JCM 21142]